MASQAREEFAAPANNYLVTLLLSKLALKGVLYGVLEKAGASGLPVSIHEYVTEEISRYFADGTTRSPKDARCICVNPMLLDVHSQKWRVDYYSFPFNGYLPFDDGELDLRDRNTVLRRSCLKILKNFVAKYKENIKRTEVYFYIKDPLEFCYGNDGKFDVIDFASLVDQHGLANILNAGLKILSDKSGATLITGTVRWQEVTTSLRHYIEQVLCCPLSLAPTIYGLHLKNQEGLGLWKPPCLNKVSSNQTSLTWERTSAMKNIHLALSLPLQMFTESLFNKCFRQEVQGDDASATQNYSPLTLFYVMNSLKKRLEEGQSSVSVPAWQVPITFKLQFKAFEVWSNGKPVKLYSLKVKPLPSLFSILTGKSKSREFTPRAVVLPSAGVRGATKRLKDFETSQLQYFDNVHLDVERNERGGLESFEFSFIMPGDQQLENYSCVLIDLKTGQQIVSALQLEAFKVEVLTADFPFPLHSLQEDSSEQENEEKATSPRVTSCLEMVDHFLLSIQWSSAISEKDVKITFETPEWPCRSTHSLEVHGVKKGKLEFTFSHPVLADEAKISYEEDSVFILLPKAIFELWPTDMLQEKLKMESLKYWVEPDDEEAAMFSHLTAQLCTGLQNQELQWAADGWLFFVRRGIITLFGISTREGVERFSLIHAPVGGDNDELSIKVHLPVRRSSSGAPLLLLTVLDKKRVKTLEQAKKLKREEVRESEKMDSGYSRHVIVKIMSQEAMNIWRYIFKLNSVKITARNWPIANLQTGKDGPWMATFVTPLYCGTTGHPFEDHLDERSVPDSEPPQSSSESPAFQVAYQNKCGKCGKTEGTSKMCSRCKMRCYCSKECQKKDWRTHRKDCRTE